MGLTTRANSLRSSTSLMLAACTVLWVGGCERRQIGSRSESSRQPPVREATKDDRTPSTDGERASNPATGGDGSSNKAIRLEVVSESVEASLGGTRAPDGMVFAALQARLCNIHPKQAIEKSKLEGKRDHTQGVGGFARGETAADREYVEVDVAYKIPRLRDHLYLLVDGVAYALAHTTDTHRAVDPSSEMVIELQGDTKEIELVFAIPEDADHTALQLLDYTNGHVLVPVRGKVKRARGDGRLPKGCVDERSTASLEIATRGVRFSEIFGDEQAAPGRTFAIVDVVGRSLSRGGAMKNIVEMDPTRYLWVTTDGGFIFYAQPRTDGHPIRFTPEVFQHQAIAFVVPDAIDRLRLGVRVENEVIGLDITERRPKGIPKARATHTDGEVMQVLFFGNRRQANQVILDLGIRPLAEERGLEIQPGAQFILVAGERELRMDAGATEALPHPPPRPFIVPPGTPVRFELAFTTDDTPTGLRVKGFRSETRIELE